MYSLFLTVHCFEHTRVLAQIELCKKRVAGKAVRKAFDENIVLVDQQMDIPSELDEYMTSNKLPLVLTVSYLPTEWKIIFECGPYSASTNGSVYSVSVLSTYLNGKHAIINVLQHLDRIHFYRRACSSAKRYCGTN
jgi:hypothetical protein